MKKYIILLVACILVAGSTYFTILYLDRGRITEIDHALVGQWKSSHLSGEILEFRADGSFVILRSDGSYYYAPGIWGANGKVLMTTHWNDEEGDPGHGESDYTIINDVLVFSDPTNIASGGSRTTFRRVSP